MKARMNEEEEEAENPSVKEYQIIFFFLSAREYHDVSHFSNLLSVSIFNPNPMCSSPPSPQRPLYRISRVSLHMFGILLKLSLLVALRDR